MTTRPPEWKLPLRVGARPADGRPTCSAGERGLHHVAAPRAADESPQGVPPGVRSTTGPGDRGEGAHGRRGIGRLHQHLAHEHCVEPGDGHARRVVASSGSRSRRSRSTSGGTSAARRSPTPRSSANVPRSRAFTPTIGRRCRAARSSSASSCVSTSTARPRLAASSWRSGEERRRRGARRRSAGSRRRRSARVSYTCTSSSDEVLAEHRELTGGAGAVQVVDRAAEVGPSVSTERHAAPPAAYALAVIAGSRSGARSPFDGERRLISAITADRAGIGTERAGEVARRRRLERRRPEEVAHLGPVQHRRPRRAWWRGSRRAPSWAASLRGVSRSASQSPHTPGAARRATMGRMERGTIRRRRRRAEHRRPRRPVPRPRGLPGR